MGNVKVKDIINRVSKPVVTGILSIGLTLLFVGTLQAGSFRV